MKTEKPEVTIFWFRRDLRLNDNAALWEALKNNSSVLPIFIFDTDILQKLPSKNDARVSFIYKVISNLHSQLHNLGSSLKVLYGKPLEVFQELMTNFKIKNLYFNHDYEPLAIQRDKAVTTFFENHNISVQSFKDQVVFEKNEVLKPNGTPYTIFTPYSKIWKQQLNTNKPTVYNTAAYNCNFLRTAPFPLPVLKEIGFSTVETPCAKPEINHEIIRNYHNTRNIPHLNATSNLSLHFRFGTISIREAVQIAQNLNETWLNELIWREFFMMILFHFPKVVTESFKKKYDFIEWRNNENDFEKWCAGETGYLMVDAGMRQLNKTGFMHNRVRMIVASFLTKHLLIDWRWGETYFAEKLLDYELSSNNGNWQWAAGCGCDAAPYFRIFNPLEQIKKFDKDLIYTKLWVNEANTNTYITPIVEHKFARQRALDTYKKAVGGF